MERKSKVRSQIVEVKTKSQKFRSQIAEVQNRKSKVNSQIAEVKPLFDGSATLIPP
jgi:septal ring factor EnvC (AmiA/AmiB activator)